MTKDARACEHGNTMGLHGRVVCVDCGAVVRPMTPEERAVDHTFRDAVSDEARKFVEKLKKL